MEFIETLRDRSALLFWFGTINLLLALILIGISFFSSLEVAGANAWFKPIKFMLSTAILSWSVAWYSGYLPLSTGLKISHWLLMISLGFEIAYISLQAGRGQLSHFNVSTPFFSGMYALMAIGATIATLCVAYLGILFFTSSFPELPGAYVWAIRLGIVIFVIFSFEGFAMGSRMSHTVGGSDGTVGLPFLGWSKIFGDLRVAHFIGMHALQVLPLIAWFVTRSKAAIVIISFFYFLLASITLYQALKGKPLVKDVISNSELQASE